MPYKYCKLPVKSMEEADKMRQLFGLRFNPEKQERHNIPKQFEVFGMMKDVWRQHSMTSGKQVVVYYQQEVRKLLETLGIPSVHLADLFPDDAEAAIYDPMKDRRETKDGNITCLWPHEQYRPCQVLLAERLSSFVWSKNLKRPRDEKKEKTERSDRGTPQEAPKDDLGHVPEYEIEEVIVDMPKEDDEIDDMFEAPEEAHGSEDVFEEVSRSWADEMDLQDLEDNENDGGEIIVKMLPNKRVQFDV